MIGKLLRIDFSMWRNELKRGAGFFLLLSFPVAAGLIFFHRVGKAPDNMPLPFAAAPLPAAPASYTRVMPSFVKALYVTMHTAHDAKQMGTLIDLARRTEINAMVIDVKGSKGELIFDFFDAGTLIKRLHEEHIWAIARIVVFQDSSAPERVPGAVIRTEDGSVWRDNRGFAWLDPAAKEGWVYLFEISKRALDLGFDEINYDYIRFPSDGPLDRARYPAWKKETSRHEVIAAFAQKAREVLKEHAPDMQLSIDIFGYTFLRNDDLGIGQKLEELIHIFDGVYPMTYPSHYKSGNFGFENPADHPYEVVKGTLDKGLERFGERSVLYAGKIRPWLQAFDLGAVYTPEKMRAQMQGAYDALGDKSTGWLLWDPGNDYDGAEEYLAL